jgi:ferredoxin-thioredoxin reductase catalytic subunit
VSVQLRLFNAWWLTDDEKRAINLIIDGAIERLVAKRERNGACPCRCKNPLEDDGSNRCPCCAEPHIDIPDDL